MRRWVSDFADIQGLGGVVAVKMAVEDFGGNVNGKPIEVVSADLQNKADVGSAIARRWYDVEKVDAILGLGNSAVAIAFLKTTGRLALGALDFGALQSMQDCADHAACHPILQIEDAGVPTATLGHLVRMRQPR